MEFKNTFINNIDITIDPVKSELNCYKIMNFNSITWDIKHYNDLKMYELYDFLKLRSDVFVVEQKCIFLDIDDKDKDAIHIIGKINGSIVAYTRIFNKWKIYNNYFCIGRVCCSKQYRGYGLGKLLLKKSIEECKKQFGEGQIKIEAQIYLKSFYESFGFIQSGDPYIEDEIEHIPMIRQ